MRSSSFIALALLNAFSLANAECTSQAKIAGAEQYVHATVTADPKDAAAVPLAPNVVRFETFNGAGPIQTGFDDTSIRASLVAGPQAFTVNGLRSSAYTDQGNSTILAIYTLDAGLLGDDGITLTTADTTEYFVYDEGLCEITRIDAWVTIPGST